MKEFIIKNKVLVIILSILLVGIIIGGSILVISYKNNDTTKEVDKGNQESKDELQDSNQEDTNQEENEVVEEHPLENEEEKEEPLNKDTNNSKPSNNQSTTNTNQPETNKTEDKNNNKTEEKTENKTEDPSENSNTSSNTGSNSTVNNSNTTNKEESKEETPKVEEQPKEEPVQKSKTYLDCKYQNNTKTVILTYGFVWDESNIMTSAYQDTSTIFDFSPFGEAQLQTIDAGHNKVCTKVKEKGAKDCKYTRKADGYSITIYHNINTLYQTSDGLLSPSMDVNTVKSKLTTKYNNSMICTIK